MIARLGGTLSLKKTNRVVLDVHGVGYEVVIPLSTYYELGAEGSTASLLIHTHVREDALQLFGFGTANEKALFTELIQISGIGPKLAVTILSGLPAEELAEAVMKGKVKYEDPGSVGKLRGPQPDDRPSVLPQQPSYADSHLRGLPSLDLRREVPWRLSGLRLGGRASRSACRRLSEGLRLLGFAPLSVVEIPTHLHVRPKVSRFAEVLGQSQGRGGCNTAATIDRFVDPFIRRPDSIRQVALGRVPSA